MYPRRRWNLNSELDGKTTTTTKKTANTGQVYDRTGWRYICSEGSVSLLRFFLLFRWDEAWQTQQIEISIDALIEIEISQQQQQQQEGEFEWKENFNSHFFLINCQQFFTLISQFHVLSNEICVWSPAREWARSIAKWWWLYFPWSHDLSENSLAGFIEIYIFAFHVRIHRNRSEFDTWKAHQLPPRNSLARRSSMSWNSYS